MVEDEGPGSTLMLRKIPLNLTRDELLEQLNAAGLSGRYNFVYLPRDFARKRGLGYALVGCDTEEMALDTMNQLQGFFPRDAEESWEVQWSQPGRTLEAHIERYRNSPVMHASMPQEYKPLIFVDGKEVPFPPPTKTIRPPRIRHLKPEEAAQFGQGE